MSTDKAGAPNVEVTVGKVLPQSDFLSYVVERDMFQPDMAAIVLSNQGDIYSEVKIGTEIELKIGDDKKSIFKGEVTGLEPIYKGGDKTKILVRGMNVMHQLLRTRKSKTFAEMSDKDIISEIATQAGLKLTWDHPIAIKYKHVYQHNQSDLEFIRTRAARIGAYVWCVDKDLMVKKPGLDQKAITKVSVDDSGAEVALRMFSPRMSAAGIVKKVTVKGWNPETKELLVGEATATASPLGKENAATGAAKLCGEQTFTVDHPIWSKEEATFLAKAQLQDSALTFITGEAEVTGDPRFDLGQTLTVIANQNGLATDPFNGNYFIVGVTHRHSMAKEKEGGYQTFLRLARDGQKNKG